MIKWGHSTKMDCWAEVEHEDGDAFVTVRLGAGRERVAFTVRRKLDGERGVDVQAATLAARAELVRVLRECADAIERGEIQS